MTLQFDKKNFGKPRLRSPKEYDKLFEVDEKVDCPNCQGTGWVVEICPECEQSVDKKCPKCGGEGFGYYIGGLSYDEQREKDLKKWDKWIEVNNGLGT